MRSLYFFFAHFSPKNAKKTQKIQLIYSQGYQGHRKKLKVFNRNNWNLEKIYSKFSRKLSVYGKKKEFLGLKIVVK